MYFLNNDGFQRRLLRPHVEKDQEFVFCGSDTYPQPQLLHQAQWFSLYDDSYPVMRSSDSFDTKGASRGVFIEDMNLMIDSIA